MTTTGSGRWCRRGASSPASDEEQRRACAFADESKAAIPEVWRELVKKGNEDLVDMLASAVESKFYGAINA